MNLPQDIVDHVLPSYYTNEEIVSRRKVDSYFFRRYLNLLQGASPMVMEELLELGISLRDEEFLLDLLEKVDGDLGDRGLNMLSLDVSPTPVFLQRVVDAKLSQAFGKRLLRFPIFVVNVASIFDTCITDLFEQEQWEDLASWFMTLLYFDAFKRVVVLPWLRYRTEAIPSFLEYLPDPRKSIDLLTLLAKDGYEGNYVEHTVESMLKDAEARL